MSKFSSTRRQVIQRLSALSAVGAASSTFGLQLATLGEAAAATATSSDYKALVCIFMQGGNDSSNMLLATDSDSWGRYTAQRGAIALLPPGSAAGADKTTPGGWGGVLPLTSAIANPIPAGTNASTRTFALTPHMSALLPIWNAGRMAAVANVGPLIEPAAKAAIKAKTVRVPDQLQSHNDQQSIWQSGVVEGARRGWGGLMADLMLSGNGSNAVFTAISSAGNAVWLAGQNVVQYQIANNWTTPAVEVEMATSPGLTVFGGAGMGQIIRDVIGDNTHAHILVKDYANKTVRARQAAGLINAQFADTAPGKDVPMPSGFVNPVTGVSAPNQLALQLHNVAKIIAANAALGIKRQVFFLQVGGFDFHSFQNLQQPPLLNQVAQGMAYFDSVLANLNGVDMRPSVTAFTASDFGRTFAINADGTDHGWGGHHFVMGGAVRGGSVYGQYPTLGVDLPGFDNPSMLGDIFIPTTSVEQYAATMGRWFGVSEAQLDVILPNLHNFSSRDVGFMRA